MSIARVGRTGARFLVAGLLLLCAGSAGPALAQAVGRAETGDPLSSRLDLMLRTMRIARDWHVERPTKAQLLAGAIDGLLARVDPEAELYARSDLRRISRFLPYVGGYIGLTVRREPPARRQERRGYRVVSVRDGSPAAAAGLKADDLITDVDGRRAGGIPYLVMAHVALVGPVGSELRLTVERGGDEPPSEVRLTRAEPPTGPGIAVEEVGPGVARLRISDLGTLDATRLKEAIAAVASLPGGASRGVVVDLRSAAGGEADEARIAGDAFLESGDLLKLQTRADGPLPAIQATSGDIAHGRPLVVLVDGGTAGAAEIVAGALHHHHRARLVGTRTAGRCAIRSLLALGRRGEKGAIRITTTRMLTPLGATCDGKGLVPEIVVEQAPASSRCRSLDIEDKQDQGRCIRRAVSEDAQLTRAIALLDEALVAAKGALRPDKP